MKRVLPFTPNPPGETLEEELQARGWSQRDLAVILGRPLQMVNEIIAGKKAITAETAVSLSQALGISADYWLALESLYRLDLLRAKTNRNQEYSVQRRARLFSKAPVSELIRKGWLKTDLNDLDRTEKALCDFLGIPSLDDDPKAPFSARKAMRNEQHTAAQIVWACRVRNVASTKSAGRYSKDRLLRLVKD